jgi:hypothetical protein
MSDQQQADQPQIQPTLDIPPAAASGTQPALASRTSLATAKTALRRLEAVLEAAQTYAPPLATMLEADIAALRQALATIEHNLP